MTFADDVKAMSAPTAADMDDKELAEVLSARGWIVHKDDPSTERHIDLDAPKRGRIKLAFESDTHIGSKYQQSTHWQSFCAAAGEWGADFMLHAGDMFDGIHKMHRGMEYEQFIHGYEAHKRYAVEHMPVVKHRKRVVRHKVIGGNHDGSYFKDVGADILTAVAAERDDVDVLGAPAATFHISGLSIYLVHPDGGVPYARSYKPQKAVEQMAPENKPHIWVAGHFHTPVHVPAYRNVEAFCLPSFQTQTPYLARKGLGSTVGGLLMELEFSERGLEDFSTKWVIYRNHIPRDW